MANYYYDCEFLEGKQDKRFLGIKYGTTKPTIDLISIGIVSEDNQEYYAISKDFNLKEAWNRFDIITGDCRTIGDTQTEVKVYWIRENVLKPIYLHLACKELKLDEKNILQMGGQNIFNKEFCYQSFKYLLEKHGKTNKQIAEEIFEFVNPDLGFPVTAYNNSELKEGGRLYDYFNYHNVIDKNGYFYASPTFYGYYSAYDHVCLSFIFGKMINLPAGFQMYTKDLKQELDRKVLNAGCCITQESFEKHLEYCKSLPNYPKQENNHSAIHDALWNKELHEFLKTI